MHGLAKRAFDALPGGLRSTLYVLIKTPARAGSLRPDTQRWVSSYFHAMKTIRLATTLRRRVPRTPGVIPPDKGYAVAHLSNHPAVAAAVAHARTEMGAIDMGAFKERAKKPFLLQVHIPMDAEHRALFDLACDPVILDPVSQYLGMIPVLHSIQLWYSPNENFEAGRSQEFHRDGEDFRQVKVFVHLNDIDESTGPFTIIDASRSRTLARGLPGPITQKHPDARIGVKGVPLTGGAGTVAFADTAQCYHFGSRPSPGAKPRMILQLHYATPFSTKLPLWGWPKERNTRDMVLGMYDRIDMQRVYTQRVYT